MHQPAFLYMTQQYSIVCAYHNLIPVQLDIWVPSTFGLLCSAALNMHVCGLFWVTLFNALGKYLGIKLWDHMFKYIWETAKLFSIAVESFYISTSNIWGFPFLYIFINTFFPFFPSFASFLSFSPFLLFLPSSFGCSHASWWKMVSCGFYLYFPND